MAPNSRIILTRHAQAEHNVGLDYTSNSDPRHREETAN
jgi:broad specificity phosphatase PhoE